MSVCSTGALSDISEFAAWEEAHPLPEGEVHEQSREQSLIDMAQPERVWEGVDSSNDARSEVDGETEVVASKKLKGMSRLPKVIPSSTQTSLGSGSQETQRSSTTVTVKGESQDLQGRKLEPESDVDVPPSSQPREESEDEDMADEAEEVNNEPAPKPTTVTKVNAAVLEESEDDLLDGFDIAPEEEEFLKELLPQASQEERGLLQRAKESDDYNGTRRLSTFQDEHEFLEYLKTSVQDFAKEHPFWTKKEWEEDDLAEFETDVHEFGVAAGMKDYQADVEVAKAIRLWKRERAVNVIPTIETASVVETVPVVGSASSNRKRKREEKKALNAVPIQLNVASDGDVQSQKKQRKENKKAQKIENRAKNAERIAAGKTVGREDCEALEGLAIKPLQDFLIPAPVAEVSAPTLSAIVSEPAVAVKPTKKEKKLAKKLRRQQGMTSNPVVANEKLNLQSSEDWYGATLQKETTPSLDSKTVESKSVEVKVIPVLPEDHSVSINGAIAEVSEANPTKKRSRKRSKQGPVASAYFPKAADSVKSESKEPSGEGESTEPTTDADIPADLAAKIAAAKAAVENVFVAQEKRKRRTKKRNHNKLPEENNVEPIAAAVQVEEPTSVAPATAAPLGGVPSSRRQRKRKDRKGKTLGGGPVDEKVAVASEETNLPVSSNPKQEVSPVTTSEPVTVTQVKADNPVSKKRDRNQDEASEPKETTTTNTATEPEEPRQKRSRNRKSRAQIQKEKEQNPAPPAELSSKPVQQEDVPMSNTTEALSELVNTNFKKQTRRDRGRKSLNKMDIDPQSTESKARHL